MIKNVMQYQLKKQNKTKQKTDKTPDKDISGVS